MRQSGSTSDLGTPNAQRPTPSVELRPGRGQLMITRAPARVAKPRNRIPFLTLCAVVLFLACPEVRSAVYEVTVKGVVTSTASPAIAFGDPFSVVFQVDATGSSGLYPASPAVITFPNYVQTTNGSPPTFRSTPGANQSVDLVAYQSLDNWSVQTNFSFPHGTLTSFEFPLTLPLELANFRRMHFDWGPLSVANGRIDDYSTAAIPEPGSAWIMIFVPSILVRSRRIR